ncbi:MAG: hypothetical protein K0S33_3003 [Bacteroidetes bacterium]|jgi:hypothetical protein|nr:hypothetical protein [Bacteroidota bacterium]
MPKLFFKDPTEKTPLVILDKEKARFELIGVSVPTDGKEFYQPVLDWMKKYAEAPLEETVFVFNLDYFNISSSKMILFVLYKLQEIESMGKKVKVKWFYNDEDLFEAGQDYEYISRLDFVFVKTSKEYLVK